MGENFIVGDCTAFRELREKIILFERDEISQRPPFYVISMMLSDDDQMGEFDAVFLMSFQGDFFRIFRSGKGKSISVNFRNGWFTTMFADENERYARAA